MANLDMRSMQDHYPERGDQVEAWIKERRGERPEPRFLDAHSRWSALDDLLDEYRLAADTSQSLENLVNGEEEQDPVDRPAKKKKKKRMN